MKKRILRPHIQAPMQIGKFGKFRIVFRLALRKELNMNRFVCVNIVNHLLQHFFKIVIAQITHGQVWIIRISHNITTTHVYGYVEIVGRISQSIIFSVWSRVKFFP